MLRLQGISVARAMREVARLHRHLPKVQRGLFATSVIDEQGNISGVGIAAHPARLLMDDGAITIVRCATDGSPNACSMIYGSLCRAAKALGWMDAWTYTLPDEPGTSLRAAGFRDMGLTRGGEHDRPSRRRAPALHPEPKRRWHRNLNGAF